jgi:glycosyltransferase involved in cell wall biosynthesis
MDKLKPIASILVTSFNHQMYIPQCLESIQSKCLHEIELIISDDGSRDESVRLIKKWIETNNQRFQEVKLIARKDNIGISQNILEMINESRSNILLPLASDDMYLVQTIDERIKFLNENPNIWVGFSDASAINGNGETMTESLYKYYNHKFAGCSESALKKELILSWNYPANIQFWRKGDWINEISPGIFSEDVEIALAALSGNKIKYLNKVLYKYRCATWPIEAKGCEKSKRLHMSYYYRKAASQSAGMTKYALLKLSEYNLSIAVNDITQARKLEKKIHFIKKLPSALFR